MELDVHVLNDRRYWYDVPVPAILEGSFDSFIQASMHFMSIYTKAETTPLPNDI